MPYAEKRDLNESELISLWRKAGCVWIEMPRGVGFDGILISPRTGIHIVEIKNNNTLHGSKKKRWELTPHEREVCFDVESVGAVYSIIQTDEQALELVE